MRRLSDFEHGWQLFLGGDQLERGNPFDAAVRVEVYLGVVGRELGELSHKKDLSAIQKLATLSPLLSSFVSDVTQDHGSSRSFCLSSICLSLLFWQPWLGQGAEKKEKPPLFSEKFPSGLGLAAALWPGMPSS